MPSKIKTKTNKTNKTKTKKTKSNTKKTKTKKTKTNKTQKNKIHTCKSCCDKSQVKNNNCSSVTLECIDFRLRDNISCQLNSLGYKNDYDAGCAPGTSLAYNNNLPGYTGFDKYFDNIVKVAYSLHKINKIILVEHEKCGAYKVAYGKLTPNQELNYQKQNITSAASTLMKKFNPLNGTIMKIPNLTILGYRISINGCNILQIY